MARSKTPQRFTVKGTGRFPIDMLRYDACWPASSDDARKVERMVVDPQPGEMVEINLTIAPGYTDPTIARWQSYGWMVMSS